MTKNNYTFRCEFSDDFIKDQISEIKKELDCNSNVELLTKLIKNHISLKSETRDKLNKLCEEKKYSVQSLLTPVVERYINKTLKGYGLIKEPHKKSVNADIEMEIIIDDIIKFYDDKPEGERKFLTSSMISKFIYKYDNKYSSKHANVIKRALVTHHKKIDDYHNRNNLSINSNYSNRHSK